MPLMDISDPANIKFLTENYNKTTLLSVRWNHKNKEMIKRAATLSREEKGYRELDVAAEAMRTGLAATARDFASNASSRKQVFFGGDSKNLPGISALRKGHSIVDIGLGDPKDDPRLARPDTDLRMDPKMRPVDPEQSAILSKGVPFFGRKVYLEKRKRILPEDKFYFQETTAWDYGWRMKESVLTSGQKRRGRVLTLTRDVMSRSGPHPDPDHYKSANQLIVSICDN